MENTPPAEPPDSEKAELGDAVRHLREAQHDLEKAEADEARAMREMERAEEEIEHITHGHDHHDHWIVVNGQRKEVHAKRLSFEEVVQIAFPVPPPGVDVKFSVQFSRGPEHRRTGTLTEGQSVEIRNGMEFDVTPTNRS